MEVYGVQCSAKDVLNLDSSTEEKFSRHLIFNLRNALFKDNVHVGVFRVVWRQPKMFSQQFSSYILSVFSRYVYPCDPSTSPEFTQKWKLPVCWYKFSGTRRRNTVCFFIRKHVFISSGITLCVIFHNDMPTAEHLLLLGRKERRHLRRIVHRSRSRSWKSRTSVSSRWKTRTAKTASLLTSVSKTTKLCLSFCVLQSDTG